MLLKINKIKDINLIIEGETLLIPASQEVTKVMDLVDSVDPDAQFYQSGVPMEQRIFEPEDLEEHQKQLLDVQKHLVN